MNFKKLIKKISSSKRALLAVLVDPDKFNPELIELAESSKVFCFLVGGSQLKNSSVKKTILEIKKRSKLPVILFPGDEHQLNKAADGLFLPSLLSGRNPDFLIEKHITMAPLIKQMKLKHAPMAYLLIEGKKASSTQKVTKTAPLDPKNSRYILDTCLAAEQLGFQLIYLEAGSGANKVVSSQLIKAVKKTVPLPLIVGGGIDSPEKAKQVIAAGANLIVVGNALEKNVHLLTEISACF